MLNINVRSMLAQDPLITVITGKIIKKVKKNVKLTQWIKVECSNTFFKKQSIFKVW